MRFSAFWKTSLCLSHAHTPQAHEQKSGGVGALRVALEKETGILCACREVSKGDQAGCLCVFTASLRTDFPTSEAESRVL